MLFQPGAPQYQTVSVNVARAAAVLAGAGAYDATPTEVSCAGWQKCTLFCAYTQGAAGGSVRFYIEVRYPGNTAWYRVTAYGPGALAAGADVDSALQAETWTFDPVAGAAERFVYSFELPSSVEALRVPCRELGNVGAPGTMGIVAVLSY